MALFGGAHYGRRAAAFLMPLAALLLSDLAIEILFRAGLYPHRGFYGAGMLVVYGAFTLVSLLGLLLRERRGSAPAVAAGALAASFLFFLVTNFAVWAWDGMYPPTASGLAACYTAALPFYGGTLLGDLFYTAVLFGAFALAERRVAVFAEAR
jgi:hypothetical protein